MPNATSRDNTLDPDINLETEGGKDDPAVKQYIGIMADQFVLKSKQDTINRAIKDLHQETFIVSNPSGTRKLNSQRLYQALWRTANRMKPLDFMLHGAGRSPALEKIVTDGVATVMDGGGYDSALRDKGGVFMKLLLYGDGFLQVGANPDKKSKIPIVFNAITNDMVYVDNYATGIRTKGWGKNASKMVIVFTYSWGELIQKWPGAKTKAGIGRIPRGDTQEDLDRTRDQKVNLEAEVEVAYGYDILNKNFTIFAGSACTILEQFDEDDYPFIKDGEAYIPISQFICMPSSEGFYNHGIGAMLYKLAIVSSRLMNMELAHVEDNTYPIELVSVPQGEAAKFFGKLKRAHDMRATGKKGFAVIERDPTNPQASSVQSQTLITQNLTNEWELIFNQLDKEIRRLGINIDELETGPSTTATEILALEENSNSFVKQVMEYNASETQFLVELTMDFITQFVGKKNRTPIDMTTKVEVEGLELDVKGRFLLGQVSDELKKNRYFVKVNSRTGAIPSNIMKRAQIARAFNFAAPGSPAFVKLAGMSAQLENIDISGEEFLPQQIPEEAAAAPQVEELLQAEPTGTDRLTFSPRRSEQTAVL